MYWNTIIQDNWSFLFEGLNGFPQVVDFRDKTRRRRWLNYEAHKEAYLENSAFIRYAARLRFHYSLVQSKVIDLETLASIGHYYFIRMVFFRCYLANTNKTRFTKLKQ